MSKSNSHKISHTLTTPWTADVDPNLPHPEYPRPQMARHHWQNLNGTWAYAITGTRKNEGMPKAFPREILVPYPLESALSGVGRQLQPEETLWYHRTFEVEQAFPEGRTLLHFGAVDWKCKAFLNGEHIGEHIGGYDPFTFDITEALQEGTNTLVLAVQDPSDSEPIQRGKQVLDPGFIWYTTVSGIWQTVWLEFVPQTYIETLQITPEFDDDSVTIQVQVNPKNSGMRFVAEVFDRGERVASADACPGETLTLSIADPKSWSPENPFLYDLTVSLLENGDRIDQVQSYFGMRKYSLAPDAQGRLRFCLNNQPYFLYGPLDQGYWPDGLYTPPIDEAMRWEIDFIKKAGFNMLRKHIKVEPARYYTHCDRAGVIVWQDMISGGISPKPVWFVFAQMFPRMRDNRFYWRLGRGNAENREQFRLEYRRMLETLYNVVSIAIWCPFNEGWGQFNAAEITEWTKAIDPTRLVDHASGWFDQRAGDFKSEHVYFKPLPEADPDPDRAWVLSEFGGYSMPLPEHAWDPEHDFGYKKFKDSEELTEGYRKLLEEQLIPWIREGLSAAVYTQTADVETEVNGFLTYDREVVKIHADVLKKIHQRLFEVSQEGEG